MDQGDTWMDSIRVYWTTLPCGEDIQGGSSQYKLISPWNHVNTNKQITDTKMKLMLRKQPLKVKKLNKFMGGKVKEWLGMKKILLHFRQIYGTTSQNNFQDEKSTKCRVYTWGKT